MTNFLNLQMSPDNSLFNFKPSFKQTNSANFAPFLTSKKAYIAMISQTKQRDKQREYCMTFNSFCMCVCGHSQSTFTSKRGGGGLSKCQRYQFTVWNKCVIVSKKGGGGQTSSKSCQRSLWKAPISIFYVPSSFFHFSKLVFLKYVKEFWDTFCLVTS